MPPNETATQIDKEKVKKDQEGYELRHRIFGQIVKDLKKRLPSNCSLLSKYRRVSGEHQIRAIINKTEIIYTVPQNLEFHKAHINELFNQLSEKCSSDVAA